MEKNFIKIIATFTEDGVVLPQTIVWEDGRMFSVDKILDIRKKASIKVGGIGLRYTCLVHGKQIYLYKEDDKWFLES